VQGAALSQPLKEGECKINYGGDPSAKVTENKFSVGAEACGVRFINFAEATI